MTRRGLVPTVQRFARYCTLIVLAGVLLVPSLALAQTNEHAAVTRARQLYQQGVSAYDREDYTTAERLLRESYQTHPHPVTLRNLAATLERLERRADACNELARLIRAHPDADERQNAERTLANLSDRVGKLEIDVSVTGADVKIDDKWVGVAPLPTWYVEPGDHKISAAKQGFKPAEASVSVGANEKQPVKLTLIATEAPGMPGAGLGTGTDPGANGGTQSGMPPKTIALITGGALTAVALGVGIVYQIGTSSAQDDVDSLGGKAKSELGRNCVSASETPTCQELDDAIDTRDSRGMIRTIGFVSAGVFAAGTVAVYFLWPDRKTAGVIPTVTASDRGGSVFLTGTF